MFMPEQIFSVTKLLSPAYHRPEEVSILACSFSKNNFALY